MLPALPFVLASVPLQGWNDGWRVMNGKPAPTIEAARWFNTGEVRPSLEELSGEVVLLEFFISESPECLERADFLSRLHRQYFDFGLRVVAITTDAPEVVEEELIAGKRAVYWIGSDPAGKMIELYKTDLGPPRAPGSRSTVGVPHTFVIDDRGIVRGEEIPSELRLEGLLEESHGEASLPPLHAELAHARELYARGALGRAWSAARELASSEDPAVRDDAGVLVARAEAYADFLRRLADSNAERGLTGRAYGLLVEIAHRCAGMEAAEPARARLRELRADPGVKPDLGAWRDFEDALLNDVGGTLEWKASAARARYERVLRDHPDVWAGRFAESALRRIAAWEARAAREAGK
jgi:peroxiredoxin